MTVMTDRPHMLTEEFEALARIAAREREGTRLEFIDGVIRSKAMPDGDHQTIIEWLTRICMQYRPELWLHGGQGIKAQAYRGGRAIPDAVLAPSKAFAGQGDWVDPDPILMAVEVTSWDSDTHRRDHVEKPRAYAETGIPVYLLIDRAKCEISVYSQPNGRRYESVHIVPYGTDIELPDPVGITLQTEHLKDWVR
ncbi:MULTISPECIES: Uma2 family endonuclease [unclassified Streptomyces]|uniref:Uma2 family endonuclease n=1 Tax=unclassified Streptomyces TaxID=2593676 RepID=UPI001BE8EDC6|nr:MULTISPECIES: Uma2 family endonuclease [unclassified Streptomyces]MBT2406723.1 Uma2 family endonuclease [Streptomyces sp. ISL-21]MBT2453754.1 Uma2 family endonuclease [Streptomyces sp. ISL-86]MBT2609001.1 Uma2 family endonuclease [Streptomyces sp. ISL-87]